MSSICCIFSSYKLDASKLLEMSYVIQLQGCLMIKRSNKSTTQVKRIIHIISTKWKHDDHIFLYLGDEIQHHEATTVMFS